MLAIGPWSVRAAQQSNGRAALEVYEQGELLDVTVASRLGTELLRGARSCVRVDGRTGFAWGRLPTGGALPAVTFADGRLKRVRHPARVVALAGEFWLAWAEGQCGHVLVEHATGAVERLRTRRI